MRDNPDGLVLGSYDHVLTAAIQQLIGVAGKDTTACLEPLDVGDSHVFLARYLEKVISIVLESVPSKERLQEQVRLANRIIDQLREGTSDERMEAAKVVASAQRLTAILKLGLGHIRPDTPLSADCLLTGTSLDPSLLSQLRKEILTADRIDILCSFIKWGGIRVLGDELRGFANREGVSLRVITTSYMGATDYKAVEFLRALPNTTIKVSYDTQRTRLHAKAYMIHRDTGFGSAYVGSANLSEAAMTDGLEWVVKISQYESPHLWEKVQGTFETYWNDAEFVTFVEAERARLQKALQEESGAGQQQDNDAVFFDLRPHEFQREVLDAIAAERAREKHRHLVVAATGTGKTMIAAFDYRAYATAWRQGGKPGMPRLLFVVHREEILRQSLNTFRAVLRDRNFGDLMVGGVDPEAQEALFVSIQTYNSKQLAERYAQDHFDYVVIDEFHRAAAPWYQSLLGYIRPCELLGLTATPERADGLDVLAYFGDQATAEIRLPDAINRKMLCPFHYFCITDDASASLSSLQWSRGGYRTADLGQIYTGNDVRAKLIIDKACDILLDVRKAMGLGFCVSIEHAKYMAAQFNLAGIRSEALHAQSEDTTRRTIQTRLRRGEINFIFVVDLYNEGVDIPEVDTVLFLRPTESLTVFLQQLGRGLRLSDGKDCLTVLDFVAPAHRSYRFDLKFKALLSRQPHNLAREVEQGFPHVPAGCAVHLERVAQQYILENISRQLSQRRDRLVEQLRTFEEDTGKAPTLARFLDHFQLSTDDIYRRATTWSRLKVDSGLIGDFADPDEKLLQTGFRRIQHVDDADWIRWMRSVIDANNEHWAEEVGRDILSMRRALMMHVSIWGKGASAASERESVERLRRNTILCEELGELLSLRLASIRSVAPVLGLPFDCPMRLHCRYTRPEILAALGISTVEHQREVGEGVFFLRETQTDLLFVTLDKTEADYSPSTMYREYAINETLFQWQSQNATSEQSPTGKRYIYQRANGNTILLFVRQEKRENGLVQPYAFLGPVDYQSHHGSQPMTVIWRLRYPMPARLLRVTARLAIG